MGRGGYNGGGTIIGWGRRWSDWSDFSKPEPISVLAKQKSKRSRRRERARARLELQNSGSLGAPAQPPKFPRSSLSQQQVLVALGLHPLPGKPQKRGPILKQLVAEGILLANGRPNPHHEKVRAINARVETKCD
jgi:hypothetical protein